MVLVPITAERKAQLDDYARRHGQDPAAALDCVLAEAHESVKAGRTQPAGELPEELRVKHGLPR